MVSRTSCCGALLLIASCAAVTPIPPSASEVTMPLTTASLAVAGNIGGRAAVIRLDPGRPLSFAKGACPVQRSPATVRVEDPTNGRAQEFPLGILPSLALGDFRFSKLEVATSLSNDACEVVLGDDALQGLTLEIDFPAARATLRRSTGEPLPGNFEPIPLTRNPNFDWPLLAVRIVQGGTTFVTPALFSLQVPASTLIGNVTELRTAQEIATQLDAWGIQALKPSRPDALPNRHARAAPECASGPNLPRRAARPRCPSRPGLRGHPRSGLLARTGTALPSRFRRAPRAHRCGASFRQRCGSARAPRARARPRGVWGKRPRRRTTPLTQTARISR